MRVRNPGYQYKPSKPFPKTSQTMLNASPPSLHLPQRNISHILRLFNPTTTLTRLRSHLPARHRMPTPSPATSTRRPLPTRQTLRLPRLHLPHMQLISAIPQTPQDQQRHNPNRHRRPSRQHPSQPLHFRFGIRPQPYTDFVVQFADLAVSRLGLHAGGHAAVVEHAA